MAIYYSVTTKGFYPDDLDYENKPSDLVKISQDAYDEFFSLKEGYAQVFDENGPRLMPISDAIEASKDLEII